MAAYIIVATAVQESFAESSVVAYIIAAVQ